MKFERKTNDLNLTERRDIWRKNLKNKFKLVLPSIVAGAVTPVIAHILADDWLPVWGTLSISGLLGSIMFLFGMFDMLKEYPK